MADWPYPLTVAALFVIVLLRAGSTYGLGRAAQAGARRTRLSRWLAAPGFGKAQRLLDRWGAPVVTASFLTVGLQTLVNLAAGLGRMPLRRYVPALVVGSVLWAFLYATVGFVTFAAWRRLYELSPVGAIVVVVVLTGALAAYIGRQIRHDREAEHDDRDHVAADDRLS
ncbi:MAG TPA: VTT domain-containing protein [Propionibacteriaceae bacterium]